MRHEATASLFDMPSPDIAFAGLDRTNFGAGWPPDTNNDVVVLYDHLLGGILLAFVLIYTIRSRAARS